MEKGKVLYRYTVCKGKFFCHEGVVNDSGFRPLVNFKDGSQTVRCPRDGDIDTIRRVGHSLWMSERDDDKARAMFIKYELDKIEQLKKQIDRKIQIVNMLQAGYAGYEP